MDLTLERVALLQDGKAVRFERHINNSPEEVWSALTDPEKISKWFAKLEGKLVENGKISFHFINTSGATVNATVTHLEQPTLLEFAWESQQEPASAEDFNRVADEGGGHCGRLLDLTGNIIRFVVAGVPGGSTLALQHSMTGAAPESKEVATRSLRPAGFEQPEIVLASWHNHMDALGSLLSQSKSSKAARAFASSDQPAWQWDRFHQLKDRYAQALR